MPSDPKQVDPKEVKQIKVKSGTFIGAAYAQLVSVTVTDMDLMLEFVFINPRSGDEGEVVSRVILPLEAARGLSETINNVLLQRFGKKGN